MDLAQPQAIRTLFFDVGYTLLYPYPSDLEICQQVCERLGLHIHAENIQSRLTEAEDFYLQHMRTNRTVWANEKALGEFWTRYYMRVLQPFVEEHDEARLRLLAEAVNHAYDSHTSWQLYPDVIPTLNALRASKKYKLGAISDWGVALGPIFQQFRLHNYFDCLLVSATTGYSKPAPRLYETALERADAIADYSIHIGDSYVLDVLGARAVGMIPILLDRKCRYSAEQVDCLLIHSLYDILKLLEIEDN